VELHLGQEILSIVNILVRDFLGIPLGSCLSRGISGNGYISKILYRTVAWAIPWGIAPLFFPP